MMRVMVRGFCRDRVKVKFRHWVWFRKKLQCFLELGRGYRMGVSMIV